MNKSIFIKILFIAIIGSLSFTSFASAETLAQRLSGYILLQVEDRGEAWYVSPITKKRIYLPDGSSALKIMASLGLGITNVDLEKIPAVDSEQTMLTSSSVCKSNAIASRLKGRILLQVEAHGEAWYVHPDKCRRIFMKDGAATLRIMQFLSLGITNFDLQKIDIDTTSITPIISKVNKRAVVIVYKNVYDSLKPEIDNFQNDVFAGLGVKVDVIQLQDSLSYTPLDIRNLLIKECQLDGINGCLNLEGVVLVGDIPYAWYAQPHDAGHQAPFMYFYEDLDASFKYNDVMHFYGYAGSGAYYGYDNYGSHEGPELYSGWIRSKFSSADFSNHTNELRAYFQKHHNFFTKQTVPSKWAVSAIHVPNNGYFSIPNLGLTVYGTEYSIDIMPDAVDNLDPVKPALLAELSKGPEVAYLHSHGGPGIIWGLMASDFSNLANLPLFMFTWGCANGNFIESEKDSGNDSITLAFIHGKGLGLSFLSKLDSNDIDVYSGNCPDCGYFINNQVDFFKYYNKGQYVGEAWLNVEHDFAAYPIPAQMQIPTPGSTPSTDPVQSVPSQLLNLYRLSGPLQRIIMGSPFIYSPTARN